MNKNLIDKINEIAKSKEPIGTLTLLDMLKPTENELAAIERTASMFEKGYSLGSVFGPIFGDINRIKI
jgi:hypothetical protein